MNRHLTLVPLDEDPDLPAIRATLTGAGLEWGHGILLRTPEGATPVIGGDPLSFEVSWLGDGARSFYGQIHDAALNPAQCALIHRLATRGNLLLAPAPGPPHLVVCGGTHEAEDVHDESAPPWLEVVCFVDTPEQLHEALHGGWPTYRSTFLDSGTVWGPKERWPDFG